MKGKNGDNRYTGFEIALIGMACRFPGANNIDEYWENLKNGVESVTFFDEQELLLSNVDPEKINMPNYVKASAIIEDIDMFDAKFFGYSPREAAMIDPQQRIFLETCWQALENAGYSTDNFSKSIGVFAGTSFSTYLINNLLNAKKHLQIDDFYLHISNEKDNLATRTSYKLNLKGPSVTLQTACSTSLVAIHYACQSLINLESDMALAGGVSIKVPQKNGYLYQEEMIYSPDGHCRPFDAKAHGTVFGNGVGVVVLKRLDESLKENDHIIAVIKGSAVNNDGSAKIGYTAPGRMGQEKVIATALAMADVSSNSIGAIETHGTGTILGDPLEFEALTRVFGSETSIKNSCAIGSVKSNFGHLECAAGVASFIKMALSLKNKALIPSINFQEANPYINFNNSPFYINTEYKPWILNNGTPRRAGVSSFGIGGTNAHVILEEPPDLEPSGLSRSVQLLTLSAKTTKALDKAVQNLSQFLKDNESINLADVAHTLRFGRSNFNHRQIFVCNNRDDAIYALDTCDPEKSYKGITNEKNPGVVFMFPGQGSQYVNMGRELYEQEDVFKREIDQGADMFKQYIDLDLREILFPDQRNLAWATKEINRTIFAQSSLFLMEYSLAKFWISWGIKPVAMIGHSIGEYVAAAISGVFSFEDAIYIVAKRAQLMDSMPGGAMCTIPLSEKEVEQIIPKQLIISVVNSPSLTVVSGTRDDINALEKSLGEKNIPCRILHTSHAFHSPMMEPISKPFLSILKEISFNPPQIPYLSNLTGTWIKENQATNPKYWVDHLLQKVKFSASIVELLKEKEQVFLEVGAGKTLNALIKNHNNKSRTIFSLPSANDKKSSLESVIDCLGQLWLNGVNPDWESFTGNEKRYRIPLPSYPFQSKRYWIEAHSKEIQDNSMDNVIIDLAKEDDIDETIQHAGYEYIEPKNDLEEGVAAILRKHLGVERIGILDNFFNLGGHSLLATQFLNEVNNKYHTKIRLTNFFERPTIDGLTRLIENKNIKVDIDEQFDSMPQVIVDLDNRYQPFPLTEMQQAQWLGRLGGFMMSNVAAHVYFEMDIENLDLQKLAQSWSALINRHEMLRVIFLLDGGQKILKSPSSYQIMNLDLRNEKEEFIETEIAKIRSEMESQVRPIDKWPLFEVRTTQLPGNISRIHFSIDLLICDAGSLRILISELVYAYLKSADTLPKLDLSFRDYVLALEKIKNTNYYKDSEKFWDKRIKELPPTAMLPFAKSINTIEKPSFERWSMHIDKKSWSYMKSLGISKGISPSIMILTAFAEILAYWSKSSHFCINTTIINRLPIHDQVSKIIGEFASFAPLEVNIAKNSSFIELARQIQKRNLENLDYRYVHGVSVLRKLAQQAGNNLGAVLPIVFTSTLVQSVEGESNATQTGNIVYIISQTPQVYFDHAVLENENGLELSWHVVEELFPEGMINDMWEAYEHILYRLANDEKIWEEQNISLIPEEQIKQRKKTNETVANIPEKLLYVPFIENAEKNPDNIAIISDEKKITYGELADLSLRVGIELKRVGAKTSGLIAIIMEKGWEQIVGVLGILQSGNAYLPIDPNIPSERIKHILKHSNVQYVLTQDKYYNNLEWPDDLHIEIIDAGKLAQLKSGKMPQQQKEDELAYIIYTSGSTGLPKGVMISHKAAHNTIIDMNQRFGINENDRVLGLSEFTFDLSVYDIFGMLAAGGSIVIPKPGASRDPQYWLNLIKDYQVTLWNSVPALMRMFIEYIKIDDHNVKLPLRMVWLSGDWIPVNLPPQIKEIVPSIEVVSLGGATEASIWSIAYKIEGIDPGWDSIPYGKPLGNQEFHVLNEHMLPCPLWVPGDLYIGGKGLAMGYLNDQEQTEKSFVINPISKERLYRTGDLGRYLPDGNIEFLGREDFQVKISGFRIELGEIEALLNQHSGVKEAIVDTWGESFEHKRLVGYILEEEKGKVDINEIKEFLRTKLPAYMIPNDFITLDSFPLTANGKIDRKSLPIPNRSDLKILISGNTNYVVETLVSIFAKVLRIADVDINKNFIAMGGDSIMGIQIIGEARKKGIDIRPEQIFEHQTISELSDALIKENSELNINTTDEKHIGKLPLMPIQYYILEENQHSTVKSNWIVLVNTVEVIDLKLLEFAFQKLVLHYDILQLYYSIEDEQWQQKYQESRVVPELDIADITGTSEEEFYSIAKDIQKELENMQVLSESPLIKLCIFQNQEGKPPYLLLVAHQLIFDYRSVGLFFNDLCISYQQLRKGENIILNSNQVTFKDWTIRKMHLAESESIYSEKNAWLNLPEKLPKLNFGESKNGKNLISSHSINLNKQETRIFFTEALKIYRSSMEELLLTVLSRSIINGKIGKAVYLDWIVESDPKLPEYLDFENTLGNLSWIYPLLIELESDEKLETSIRNVKENVRRIPNLGESYGLLKYISSNGGINKAAPEIKFSCHPQIKQNSMFNWISLKISSMENDLQKTYKLAIDVYVINDVLNIQFSFNQKYCDNIIIEKLASDFLKELQNIVNNRQSINLNVISPCDFPDAELSREELALFLKNFSENLNPEYSVK